MPARTSSTALAAASWLWAASTSSKPEMSTPAASAVARDLGRRPDQDRHDDAGLRRLDGTLERTLLAGVGDGAGDRRDRLVARGSAPRSGRGPAGAARPSSAAGRRCFSVGAITVARPVRTTAPSWLVQLQSNLTSLRAGSFSRAVTVDTDHVVGMHGRRELQVLADIDRAGARQPVAQQIGDQAGGQHAVGDDAPHVGGLGEFLVEMGRVGVAGDGGEELDVAPGDGPLERRRSRRSRSRRRSGSRPDPPRPSRISHTPSKQMARSDYAAITGLSRIACESTIGAGQ